MHIDVWKCDLCPSKAEGLIPEDWRILVAAHPEDKDECQEWHICALCEDKPISALKFDDRSKVQESVVAEEV